MGIQSQVKDTFKWALPVAVVAGVVAMLLGNFLSGFASQPTGQILLSVLLIVALVALKVKVKIDNVSLYDIVILFAAITLVGTIVGLFAAQARPFILAIGDNLTVSGLLFTFLYIGLAELVISKVKKR